jgi:hypothetical protein
MTTCISTEPQHTFFRTIGNSTVDHETVLLMRWNNAQQTSEYYIEHLNKTCNFEAGNRQNVQGFKIFFRTKKLSLLNNASH